jgi:hypothetical protein
MERICFDDKGIFVIPKNLSKQMIDDITDYKVLKEFISQMKWGGRGGHFKLADIKKSTLKENKIKAITIFEKFEDEKRKEGEEVEGEEIESSNFPSEITTDFINNIKDYKILRKLATHKGWGGKGGYFVVKHIKKTNLKEQKEKAIQILEKEILSSKCHTFLDKALASGDKVIENGIEYIRDKKGFLIDVQNKVVKVPTKNKKNLFTGYGEIDLEDYELVSKHPFHIKGDDNIQHLIAGDNNTVLPKILLKVKDGENVIYKNGNGLDCKKDNLAIVSTSQLIQSRPKKNENASSKYKGVTEEIKDKRYRATINFEKEYIHIGYFSSEKKAAKAYDYYAYHYYGEFCGNNKLLTMEEIQNTLLYGLPDEFIKSDRELPKNICRKGDFYAYYFTRKSVRYYKKVSKNLDKTVSALEKKIKEIEKKNEKIENDENVEITRDENGFAVIYLHNINMEIVGMTAVDDHVWLDIYKYACHLRDDGRAGIYVDGENKILHVYLYETYVDEILEPTIDHINLKPLDNRLENLRPASFALQSHNRNKIANSIIKDVKGVTINGNRFVVNPYGTRYSFEFLEDASNKFNELALERFGNDAKLNPEMKTDKTRVLDLFDEKDITEDYINDILHIEHLKQVIKKKKWTYKIYQSNIRSKTFEEAKSICLKILREEMNILKEVV